MLLIYLLFWEALDGPEKDHQMVNSSGAEKDQLKAWLCYLFGSAELVG